MTSREDVVILIQNGLKDFFRIVDEKNIIVGDVILMSDEDKQYSRRSQVEPTPSPPSASSPPTPRLEDLLVGLWNSSVGCPLLCGGGLAQPQDHHG